MIEYDKVNSVTLCMFIYMVRSYDIEQYNNVNVAIYNYNKPYIHIYPR